MTFVTARGDFRLVYRYPAIFSEVDSVSSRRLVWSTLRGKWHSDLRNSHCVFSVAATNSIEHGNGTLIVCERKYAQIKNELPIIVWTFEKLNDYTLNWLAHIICPLTRILDWSPRQAPQKVRSMLIRLQIHTELHKVIKYSCPTGYHELCYRLPKTSIEMRLWILLRR